MGNRINAAPPFQGGAEHGGAAVSPYLLHHHPLRGVEGGAEQVLGTTSEVEQTGDAEGLVHPDRKPSSYTSKPRSLATMPNRKDYGPSIPLARLYEKVSRTGNHYLTGRLGVAKITILKSSDVTDDGVPMWNMLISEPPSDKRPRAEKQQVRELSYTAVDPDEAEVPSPRSHARSGGGFATPAFADDEIPF